MSRWIIWGLLLIANNLAGTLTSRARNSSSYGYHAVTAFSNHVCWFMVNFIFVDTSVTLSRNFAWAQALRILAYYSVCSSIGSISAHYVSINFFEKGNRRVGVYEDTNG